jgi:hypothetical protein
MTLPPNETFVLDPKKGTSRIDTPVPYRLIPLKAKYRNPKNNPSLVADAIRGQKGS